MVRGAILVSVVISALRRKRAIFHEPILTGIYSETKQAKYLQRIYCWKHLIDITLRFESIDGDENEKQLLLKYTALAKKRWKCSKHRERCKAVICTDLNACQCVVYRISYFPYDCIQALKERDEKGISRSHMERAITLAQWFQQLPIEQWEEALDLTITLDTFINVDRNQHNFPSLGIPHFSSSLVSEEHRRVHSSQPGKVLMSRLTRTNKNDPLKVELLLPNQQFCLWINRIVYRTQVHPTGSNGKIHGICDANTRANLSTMEKPERAKVIRLFLTS
ncbi:hypothetical protein T07_13300 [Trichinella nelsoni]|uniref:Uncharacterized protein n=1 Tax=Trichinella nelsoni TaxID=6336 RepID=A0A0V0SL39_9BILA|nr:hypothetical protein T07_13300 [Trichinella nelsoni]